MCIYVYILPQRSWNNSVTWWEKQWLSADFFFFPWWLDLIAQSSVRMCLVFKCKDKLLERKKRSHVQTYPPPSPKVRVGGAVPSYACCDPQDECSACVVSTYRDQLPLHSSRCALPLLCPSFPDCVEPDLSFHNIWKKNLKVFPASWELVAPDC